MRTQEEWYQLIRQWETSNLTREEFCLAHHLNFGEFRRHRSQGLKDGVLSNQWHRRGHGHHRQASGFSQIEISGADKVAGAVDVSSIGVTDHSSAPIADSMIEVTLPHGICLRIPCHVGCA